jgi:homoserine O-acetyltransferase
MRFFLTTLFSLLFIIPSSDAFAVTTLVTKQRFELPSFTTYGGEKINHVAVGWESYGSLNAAKDNTVLITHFFSGSSHAAGKYHLDDTTAGYWDEIIGPGKAIDTDKYFVLSVDSLANLNAYDDNVITTGPATINPATGKPYGLNFPVVTIRDFVNIQKAVLESLGIQKLHAVIGPSMGSMQALEWASTYPSWVPRMVSVIGAGKSDAWATAALELWAMPIRLDKQWQQGAYSPDQAPLDGLSTSLMMITLQALHPEYINKQGEQLNYHPLEIGPLNSILHKHSIVQWLEQRARSRAVKMDANHLLYLVRACQLYIAGNQDTLAAGMQKVQAKTLFLPAKNDLLLMPYMAKLPHELLTAQGNDSQYIELQGGLGHLEGVLDISEQADTLKAFLQN